MANIAEMVKELQQERDRLNQAIAALAPLAGTNRQHNEHWQANYVSGRSSADQSRK